MGGNGAPGADLIGAVEAAIPALSSRLGRGTGADLFARVGLNAFACLASQSMFLGDLCKQEFGDGLNHDIQILRAFSVLIILAGHNYLRFVYEPLMFSLTYVSTWVGVDVFFAISGYVITLSLLKTSHSFVV